MIIKISIPFLVALYIIIGLLFVGYRSDLFEGEDIFSVMAVFLWPIFMPLVFLFDFVIFLYKNSTIFKEGINFIGTLLWAIFILPFLAAFKWARSKSKD